MKKLILGVALALCVLPSQSQEKEISLKGKELFGSMKARHIGPALMSGRITDLEADHTNNRIIYAGTAGGGVWKTNDGGATFSPIFDDYCQSIGVVAVDPKDSQTIWVGTGETWTRNSVSVGDGLYKSTDGGINWDKFGFEKSDRIASIEINPNNTNEIYIGVLGALWGDSDERGVYKTNDGGKTWNKILYVDQKTGCADLLMDPNNPSILYASFWEYRRTGWSFNSGGEKSALYKSTDSGKTWNKIHNGFPSGKYGRIGIAIAPSDANILYAVLETEKDKDKGLYRSDNAGKTWKHTNNDFGLTVRPFYFSRIVVDPKNPDVVVKGGLSGSISRDGGNTFKSLGRMHADIHDILFDINDSDRMYVATDGGIYRSWNGGTTMEIVESIPVSQFYHISVDNKEPYNVYGGLQDNGSWYGPSSAVGGVRARNWESVGYGDGFRVLKHPTKNIIYSESQGAKNVWRFNVDKKQTKTVQPLPVKGAPKLRFNWNAPMALSEKNPDRFYMASQFLHQSDDMGETWKIISPDLTTNDPLKLNQENSGGLSKDNSGAENHCTIFTIAESPKDQNVIWVGTDDGNVQVTKDAGKSWTNTTANFPGLPANTWCYHIEASVFGAGTAYAVFDGHTTNDKNTYAYKTTNYGETWISIVTDDIYGFTRNIQEDYENENLLFLGTEFGLYVTINGGKNWSKFENNMPATAVHFIDLQKKTNDLVMGTHGRGVIIIDDISPLRQINREVLNKDVHFFDTKATTMYEDNGFAGSFGGETQFVGQNPSRSAQIIYYLKKRHTFGKMSMKILNDKGEEMTTLVPGKSKGINIVNWDYTMKQPKTAKGKTFSFGGFTAPRVPDGTYKVVIKKGKKTYETTLELKYADNGIAIANRKEQERVTKKLYDMTQNLAYTVYEVDEILSYAKMLNTKNKKANKATKQLISELETLKKTLVITTGDNYVGTAEPELREKIASLYSKIASTYDTPTSAELGNITVVEERYNKSMDKFQEIKAKRLSKVNSFAKKNELSPIAINSFEEFLKK